MWVVLVVPSSSARSPLLSWRGRVSFQIHLAPSPQSDGILSGPPPNRARLIELSRWWGRRGSFFALCGWRYFRTSPAPRGTRRSIYERTALKIHEEPVRVNMGQVEILEMFLRFCFSPSFFLCEVFSLGWCRPSGKVFLLHDEGWADLESSKMNQSEILSLFSLPPGRLSNGAKCFSP